MRPRPSAARQSAIFPMLVPCLLASAVFVAAAAAEPKPAPVTPAEAREIAVETYIFTYPLIMSELTRRNSISRPDGAPMNQFRHVPRFPDANFSAVVRPNADTLYSVIWYDVSREPLVVTVPDSGGRYYLLQILDMWSDSFTAPGTRTTGNQAQLLVLANAGWKGEVPRGANLIYNPTAMGWLLGRTQTNGAADYPNVHEFQAGLTVAPLSQLGQPYSPPKTQVDPTWDIETPPVVQIEKLSAAAHFELAAELMKLNPPHQNDCSIVYRMARIGIVPGKSFSLRAAAPEVQTVLEAAPAEALQLIKSGLSSMGIKQNGWKTNVTAIGTYGTAYRARARVAYGGFGANPIEDAIYPTAFADADGQPFSSDSRYVLHFAKDELPPVRAFWSLTMYNERQLFAANPINRYAIGDRDKLKFNSDGSLDLYIQRQSPGADKESNWLPAPSGGAFTLGLRLYWPKAEVLDGAWSPPPVKRLE